MITRRTALTIPLLAFVPPSETSAQARQFEILIAKPSWMKIVEDDIVRTPVLRFQEKFPVAILRVKQGEVFRCHLVNKTPHDIWLHWHGVRGSIDAMTVMVEGGVENVVQFEFTPPDAGTYWFGPLLDASRLRDSGLYGMLIVEEKKLDADFYDQPLVLDDWLLNDKNDIDDDFGNMERAIGNGRMGNWFTVNGVVKPKISLPSKQISRLRLLNAANTRTFNINFNGGDFYVIARDGQPVPFKALPPEGLELAPGQRADLLLTNAPKTLTMNFDLFEDVVEAAVFETGLDAGKFEVPDNFALPPNPVPAIPEGDAIKFDVTLEGGAKGGLKQAKLGQEVLPLRGLIEKKIAWAINGIAGLGGDLLFTTRQNSKLHLNIANKTAFAQCMAIQGHVWRVLDEQGAGPFADTIVVPSMSTKTMELVAANPGTWAIFSTIAERADAGLIGQFEVTYLP